MKKRKGGWWQLKNLMKLKSIFIANLAEIARPLAQFMSQKAREEEIFEDNAYCDRFLFSEEDNRLLVTPFPLDKQFVKDVSSLLGFKNLTVLHPKKIGESICESILKDSKLNQKLREIISQNPGISLCSYAATPEFLELTKFLKKKGLSFHTPEIPIETKLWTASFFDSKAGFRQAVSAWLKNFPKMPKGAICSSKAEILGWADYFLKAKEGVVLKTNRGLSGAGMRIIRRKDIKGKKTTEFIKKILGQEPYWQKEATVVEELIEPDLKVCGGAPSVELKVNDQGVIPLYACGMRISSQGVFKGVKFGKKAVPPKIEKILFKAGKKFARFLFSLGYQGFFDIDWVYGKNGQVYPLEANLRRTGGTHAYELAKRLLGNDFLNKYYLVSQMKTSAPRFKNKTYAFLKAKLDSFFYPIKGKKEGVILTVLNYLKKGKLGYTIIGPNKKRVGQIEKNLLKSLYQ